MKVKDIKSLMEQSYELGANGDHKDIMWSLLEDYNLN